MYRTRKLHSVYVLPEKDYLGLLNGSTKWLPQEVAGEDKIIYIMGGCGLVIETEIHTIRLLSDKMRALGLALRGYLVHKLVFKSPVPYDTFCMMVSRVKLTHAYPITSTIGADFAHEGLVSVYYQKKCLTFETEACKLAIKDESKMNFNILDAVYSDM